MYGPGAVPRRGLIHQPTRPVDAQSLVKQQRAGGPQQNDDRARQAPAAPPEDTVRHRQYLEQKALELANRRVAQWLQRPEQLDRIGEHRRQIVRDKTAVDARIKTLAEQHTENFKTALTLLRSSDEMIDEMRLNFGHMFQHCQSAESAIGNWDAIKEINRQRNHLINTRTYIDNIFTALDTAKGLDADMDREDCNLLHIHSRKSELEVCRDELLYYVKDDEIQQTALQAYFSDVDKLDAKLEKRLWQILSQVATVLQTRPSLLVSVLHIVEREEVMDEEAAQGLWKLDLSRRPKQYRKKALATMVRAVNERFEAMVVDGDCRTTIANFRFIIPDLLVIKEEGQGRFPPSYNVFQFYLDLYHRHAREVVDGFADSPDLETADIWLLLSYSDQYAEDMDKKLGVDRNMHSPPMLQGRKGLLMDRYVELISQKMKSWCKNIILTEWEEWFTGKREDPPDTNTDGHYISQVPIILFQMIDQQVDVAHQANNAVFKNKVVKCCAMMLSDFTAQFMTAVSNQGQMYMRQQGHNEFFLEYMMVIINNSQRCQAYCHQLASRLANEGITEQATMAEMRRSLQGFETLGALGYRMLIDVVFSDIDQFFGPLFSKQWYSGSAEQSMGTIIATLEDYCSEFKEHINDESYRRLTVEIHESFLKKYVQRLFDKGTKIKPECSRRMRQEMNIALSFFVGLNVPGAKEKQDTVLVLAELCEVSEEMMALHYVDLKTRQPELTMDHVEHVLQCREDLSRSQRTELLETMRSTPVKQEKSKMYLPGFFTAIKVPDKSAW
eukprot:comp22930_c1_seq1/m.36320 comp22930_c1_seq1/g.36320  ORF comp22930_c1_seq1/g.36320 comp22930_c1_seq1/m.36320 type:complete len:783 (-) comp22930_c1_seq1:684-3032(-)